MYLDLLLYNKLELFEQSSSRFVSLGVVAIVVVAVLAAFAHALAFQLLGDDLGVEGVAVCDLLLLELVFIVGNGRHRDARKLAKVLGSFCNLLSLGLLDCHLNEYNTNQQNLKTLIHMFYTNLLVNVLVGLVLLGGNDGVFEDKSDGPFRIMPIKDL